MMSLNSEASMENNQQHVECTPPKQTKTKQNGTMETVLTKLYSKEMVTKNKPKCEEWILRVAQCAVFSTAVLAAWFKFSQTNEVWPLVHNRENYFTSIQIGLVNKNQIIPVKILNNTMP